MADFADDGQVMEELALQRALEAQRKAAEGPKLPPRGFCYNCEEPLEKIDGKDLKLFCDADCCEDWEYRMKKRNGR